MRIVLFCHSLISDWNHGNAHFLRGVASELQRRGHHVRVLEPAAGWSRANLRQATGDCGIAGFAAAYPGLSSERYDPPHLELDRMLAAADLVIVHEWTDPALVARIGAHRRRHGHYRLLFHDTHHRAVTAAAEMARYDLGGFDGVLAFGAVLRDLYLARGWARRAWIWHEAADTRIFRPIAGAAKAGDLVWVGNWGDDERSRELAEFLIAPVAALGLRATVYGVRYPAAARRALAAAGIAYAGYLPNHRVPEIFARYRLTIHVPRRPYATALPGIPTIRIFEALACGIPLISAPWQDGERLFAPGRDFLMVRDGAAMRAAMARLLGDPAVAAAQARHGLATIRARHGCRHRVDELLAICAELGLAGDEKGEAACAAG